MSVRILVGDALEQLRTLSDKSVHMCVTSPPYWGLRDYGTATWIGGLALCNHQPSRAKARPELPNPPSGWAMRDATPNPGDCSSCGARRTDSQIGLESSPQEWVDKLVSVFREIRRVLRDDGTLWVNMGDSYNAQQGNGYPGYGGRNVAADADVIKPSGLPAKNLIGQPWRLAFALQADGWYLRSDIIWSKPNPMPESVTDRPTKAHEYMFLLSKQARYYYDADAVREYATRGRTIGPDAHVRFAVSGKMEIEPGSYAGETRDPDSGRNLRTVWEIPTHAFPDAHFATFPPRLVEPCIKAGSPLGGTVLDPFLGSGTTALVADRLGRDCIGIELNAEYAEMARKRIESDCPLFADVAADSTIDEKQRLTSGTLL